MLPPLREAWFPECLLPVTTQYRQDTKAREGLVPVSCGSPLCPPLGAPPPAAPKELPPAAAPGPFSALLPTRFILDDSALYLSDKCELEAPDLRRGGQGPGLDSLPSEGQCPLVPRAATVLARLLARVSAPIPCVHTPK